VKDYREEPLGLVPRKRNSGKKTSDQRGRGAILSGDVSGYPGPGRCGERRQERQGEGGGRRAGGGGGSGGGRGGGGGVDRGGDHRGRESKFGALGSFSALAWSYGVERKRKMCPAKEIDRIKKGPCDCAKGEGRSRMQLMEMQKDRRKGELLTPRERRGRLTKHRKNQAIHVAGSKEVGPTF